MPKEDQPATLADVIKPVETVEPAAKTETESAAAGATNETIPSKYEGKSPVELAKMLEDAQSMIGRQSAEIGQVRSLADRLIEADVTKRTTATEPTPTKVELNLDDPDEATGAIQKLIDMRVEEALAGVNTKVSSLEGASVQTRLDREFSDWRDVAKDEKFLDWVTASPIRKQLAEQGNAGSYDASAELLGTWKALNPTAPAGDTTADETDPEAARAAALKNATLETGASATSRSSGKVWSAADLMKLRMNDPDQYDAHRAEIRQAYAEGRVK